MRLIDADEFKKQIVGMAIINNYPADKANQMCELIDLRPTAFDLDKFVNLIEEKVVEELGISEEKFFMDKRVYASCNSLSLNDVLEIIQKGLNT